MQDYSPNNKYTPNSGNSRNCAKPFKAVQEDLKENKNGCWVTVNKDLRKRQNSPNEKCFQIKMSNKFSCLTNDVPNISSKSFETMDNSKHGRKFATRGEDQQQHLSKQSMKNKYRKSIKKSYRETKHNLNLLANQNKDSLSRFETKNKFDVFLKFSKDDVDEIIYGKKELWTATEKRKCRKCGFKNNCHLLHGNCNADGKICTFCLKSNHFPMSANCKKRRNTQKRRKREMLSGCQTLRHFLKSKKFKLVFGPIPFDSLLEINNNSSMMLSSEIQKMELSNAERYMIADKVVHLEFEMQRKQHFLKTPIKVKFFTALFLLLNLEEILMESFLTMQKIKPEKDLFLENYVTLEDRKDSEIKLETPDKERMDEDKFEPNLCSTPVSDLNSRRQKNLSLIPQTDAMTLLDESSFNNEEFSMVLKKVSKEYPELLLNRSLYSSKISSDLSPIFQVDGNSEETFTGLAAIKCEHKLLATSLNVFRSFEQIWNKFENHIICKKAKNKVGLRCMFCHIRSFSLRVNSAKIKVSMNPVEIMSQSDQLPDEEYDTNKFIDYFKKMLELIASYEESFQESFIMNHSTCDKSILNLTYDIDASDVSILKEKSTRCLLQNLFNEKKRNCGENLNENAQLILLTFVNPTNIQICPEIELSDSKFRLISHVTQINNNDFKTTINHSENYYSMVNNSFPEKNKSQCHL